MPEVFFAGSYCRGFLYSPLYHFESGVLIHVKEAVSGEEIERSLQKTLSCHAGKFLSLSTCREQRREVLSTFQDGCQTIYEFRTGCRILGFFLLKGFLHVFGGGAVVLCVQICDLGTGGIGGKSAQLSAAQTFLGELHCRIIVCPG